ncbi:hypothetical protein G6F50_014873 [Rhizopus delemar]|uniref:Uncharacterized protein n=1 Tax=Rhizopus delemar TaxID=936053 RepID=A0A9P7C6H6_9FUNG|nr:hypothetical protein G6F50_014873 [Rhizopus delemar]
MVPVQRHIQPAAGFQYHHAAGMHGGRDQGFRGHAPAESARCGFDETGGGGQFILAVEHQHRCACQGGGLHAIAEVLAGEAGRGDGVVAHRAERMHVAAFHRLAFGGDRAEHAAIAQQLQGVVLVVHAQVEQVAVALVQFGDRRYEPGIERVVVDRQGDRPPRPPVPAWAGRGAAGPLRRRWAGTVPGARPVPGRA